MTKSSEGQSAGIQSLDTALRLLSVMADQAGPTSLTDLARASDMPPSKVHRYLASFLNAGLVAQGGRSGKYDLGPGAMRLGLAAIARHDFVNRPSEALADLRDETGLTVLLSVWGGGGATVVRWERAAAPVVTSMGLGTTLPLLNSSSGRAFLAWAPRPPIQTLLEAELRRMKRTPALASDFVPTVAGVDALCAKIRAQGHATVDGDFIPGLVALAAPILDWQGEAQAVITLIGTEAEAIESGSHAVQSLVHFCQSYSFAPIGAPL
jgi:DNA-binding IclR family transcriptional regulator|tara:strand:- start:161 stop:958 length:798 start_codon:yes stop_codon:yes gene_type:complete